MSKKFFTSALGSTCSACGYTTLSCVLMAEMGCCGFYLAVEEPGTRQVDEMFEPLPGTRRLGIPEMFAAKMANQLR